MTKTQIFILYFYGKLLGIFLLLISSLLQANERCPSVPLPHKKTLNISDSLSISASSKKSDTIYVAENTLIYDSNLIFSAKNTPVKIAQIQTKQVKLKKTSRKKNFKKRPRKNKQNKIHTHRYTASIQPMPPKTSISHTWDNVLKTCITSSNPCKKAPALKPHRISFRNKYLIYLIRFCIDYSFPIIISILFIASYRLRPPPAKKSIKIIF